VFDFPGFGNNVKLLSFMLEESLDDRPLLSFPKSGLITSFKTYTFLQEAHLGPQLCQVS